MDSASRRSVLIVLGLGYGVVTVIPAVCAGILLLVAETGRGHAYAVAGVCFLALPPLVVRALVHRGRGRAVTACACAALLAGLVVGLYAASPDGHPLSGSPLRSEFLATPRYRRLAVAALLPEIDQVKLGTYIAPAFDPIIDVRQARHIRDVAMRHYRPMEADPQFAALGTVMPDAYADRDAAHLYAYAPPHPAGQRLPAVVFLHGSAGNFKAYFYIWKRFADEEGMIVVCPSFGFGNWDEPGGVQAVERARAWAVATLDVDAARVFLVGLSNGGTGVTRAAASAPGAYRGLVFISGVLEDAILRKAHAAGPTEAPWSPILVIHGAADDRIPLSEVRGAVTRLRARGAPVDERIVDGEDHFLFFDRDVEVLREVAVWVNSLP